MDQGPKGSGGWRALPHHVVGLVVQSGVLGKYTFTMVRLRRTAWGLPPRLSRKNTRHFFQDGYIVGTGKPTHSVVIHLVMSHRSRTGCFVGGAPDAHYLEIVSLTKQLPALC